MFPQRVLVAMSALRDQFTSLVQQDVTFAAFQDEVFLAQAKDALSCDGAAWLTFLFNFPRYFRFSSIFIYFQYSFKSSGSFLYFTT